jgi:nucleoside-diphosphate-sugar epimerase
MKHPELLITGASGWLGRSLLNALVHGLDSYPGSLKLSDNATLRILLPTPESLDFLGHSKNKIEVVFGDVRNFSDCKRFFKNSQNATLFHTAGVIHPKKIDDFFDINFTGTSNILQAAELAGVKRAVVVSSNSPIGCNRSNSELFDENSPFNPYMGYGKSKMLMEQEIIRFQEYSNLEIVRIRAPWFYGPFQPDRQTLFFKMIRGGKFPIVGNGENKRSMVYIDNLSYGMMMAAITPAARGNVYWIADERPYSMNEIISTIEDLMIKDFSINCSMRRMHFPNFTSEIAYLIDKMIQSIGFYNQKIHVLSEMNKTIACRIDKAKEELGYIPKIGLREGMRRSILWMLNNGVKL